MHCKTSIVSTRCVPTACEAVVCCHCNQHSCGQQELEGKLLAAQRVHDNLQQRCERCKEEETEALATLKVRREEHTQADTELSQLRPASRPAAANQASDDPHARRIRDLQQELRDDTDRMLRLRSALDIERGRVEQCRDALESVRRHIGETTASLDGLEARVEDAKKALEVAPQPPFMF